MKALFFLAAGLLCLLFALAGLRQLTIRYSGNRKLLEYHAIHLTLWLSAVFSLSGCFAVYRRFAGEQPNPHPLLNDLLGAFYAVVLLMAFMALGFFMYRDDCRRGLVKRKFRLYDQFIPPTAEGQTSSTL